MVDITIYRYSFHDKYTILLVILQIIRIFAIENYELSVSIFNCRINKFKILYYHG